MGQHTPSTQEPQVQGGLNLFSDMLNFTPPTGPLSPQPVSVDSVGNNHVILSWNVSAFMQMTPHSYNVTTCTNTCDTLFYPYTDGSALMNINISNLSSATESFIEISALVVRPDSVTGGNVTLRSKPTALRVRTGRKDLIYLLWKSVCFVMRHLSHVMIQSISYQQFS